MLTCRTIDALAGRRLFFKAEPYQRIGAFKFRGACNAVMKLSDEAAARGVVTHSSGNHAQALALAASLRGIDATIVMPTSAPAIKRDAVLGYLEGSVNGLDRRFDSRQFVGEPSITATEDEVTMTFTVRYDKAGLPPLVVSGTEVARYAGGMIERMEDVFDADAAAGIADWLTRHQAALD